MTRPELMSEDEIEFRLRSLVLWSREDGKISRHFAMANFVAAVGLVNAVAVLAETADHHPDILLNNWNKMKITLTTHDKGGLTILDFQLAEKIDALQL